MQEIKEESCRMILVQENEGTSEVLIETKDTVSSSQTTEVEGHESDASADTIEDNEEKPPPVTVPPIEIPGRKSLSDDDGNSELFCFPFYFSTNFLH